MNINKEIQQLDDRTVISIISNITAELREEIPEANKAVVKSEDEARAVLTELLRTNGVTVDDSLSGPIIPDNKSKEILQLLWNDEDTRTMVDELIANPPVDSQKSVGLAISAAVIIGGLISWLQTKIEIKVTRKDGKVEYDFHVIKGKTGNSIIKDVVSSISKIISK